jgi:ribosomal protein L18E
LLDVAQSPDEQLDVVIEALRGESRMASLKISRSMAERLEQRAVA